MQYVNLVEQFCTPPVREESDFDRKAFTKARWLDIEWENRVLKAYTMGSGRRVLLVHGWGSRASHLSLLARYLAGNDFHVITFDGPAHGNSRSKESGDTSSMFEFGKAISCVARQTGDVYAVIGHSLGAIAAAFTIAGTGFFADYRIMADKLILISAPESLARIIENYGQRINDMHILDELTRSLEKSFSFKVSDYSLSPALKHLAAETLIIHDEEDEEIPVEDALKLHAAQEKSRLMVTRGYGHKRILINRDVFKAVKNFLAE